MVNLQVYKHWEIKDKNGKIRRTRRKKCKSFVKQMAQMIELMFAHPYGTNADTATIKDTGGTNRTVEWGAAGMASGMASEAPAAEVNYGLLVGTGTTTPTINDYTPETKIAHGTGAGQLQYGAGLVSAARIEGSSAKVLMQRAYTNGSGGSITVRESGLVIKQYALYYLLLIHEAENQAIANGETGTLYYDFIFTV